MTQARIVPGCRWPAGLLGMLAIIVLAESFVARHWIDFTGSPSLSWTLSGRAAVLDAKKAQILCFGDSLVKHGLLPEIIGPRLGRTACNLSTSAAQAPTSYYLLKHVLDAGARPEAIVVDFMPDLLGGNVGDAARHWPELLTTAETIELAMASRSVTFLVRTAVNRVLPSNRSRWEIRGGVLAALRGEANPLRAINRTLTHNWAIHGGAQFTRDNPAFDDQSVDAQGRTMSGRFRCTPLNQDYIDRFFRLAESRAIPVYWVLPPASPALQSRRERGGANERYSAFVREVAARHPGVVVLDARRSGFDPTRFVDPIHLTGKGAIALSTTVVEAMASRRSGWIDLPPAHEVSPPRAFEDLEQSRVVVRSLMARSERR